MRRNFKKVAKAITQQRKLNCLLQASKTNVWTRGKILAWLQDFLGKKIKFKLKGIYNYVFCFIRKSLALVKLEFLYI
jgi:hypothetical protein